MEADGRAVVIVNPHHGDLSDGPTSSTELMKGKSLDMPGISAGILLKQDMTPREVVAAYEAHKSHDPVFIHAGFAEAKGLTERLGSLSKDQCHVFIDKYCGKLYQRHFKAGHRVLIEDGFQRKRNRDYELIEPFSDLHATFPDEGMDGFGDFLIVGDDYSGSGGDTLNSPALIESDHLMKFDVVVANPPFSLDKWGAESAAKSPRFWRHIVAVQKSRDIPTSLPWRRSDSTNSN